MQIHFKATNYEITPEVSAHANKKLLSLKKYLGKRDEVARAYVDIGKETEAHQNGKIWRTDINLDYNGTRFYAKALEETVENAIDKAANELASELQTARKRELTMMRKGGAVIKSLVRGFQT